MGIPGATAWMIIPTFTPVVGGAQTQVHQLSEALISKEWTIKILTRQHSYAHPEGLPKEEMVKGLPVRRVYSRGRKSGSLLYLLGGLWQLRGFDPRTIYHAHDIGAAGWLAVAARYLYGGKCLIKLRTGAYAYRRDFKSRFARWQMLALLRLVDRIIVVNREVEEFVTAQGIPENRIVRIPNGVDTTKYRPPMPSEKVEARRKCRLPQDALIVLYVGRLEGMKGVDVLLKGWSRLPEEQLSYYRLLLVGDGPERKNLERLAETLNISSSIKILGEQSEVLPFYQSAELFVLPSRTEGLSNALLEAMSAGLPVIASEVGGAKDLIVEQENGFFFRSEDEQELAAKLCLLLADPNLRAKFGCGARSSVSAYAGLPMIVDRLHAVYLELLDS